MPHSLLMHKIALYWLLLVPMALFAENPALVSFSDINYEEALVKGKEQNKLIFINYNAHDVDPCKQMEKTTFSNREVIDLLNDNFININADIDKRVGKEWVKKFGVECLPTFMVLDNKGKLEGINQGTLSTVAFINWITNMPAVQIKIEEEKQATKASIKKKKAKSDNLLAIKRKLKEAEGSYVNSSSTKTKFDKKIADEINRIENNSNTSENAMLITDDKETVITVLNEAIEEETINEETIDEEVIEESMTLEFMPEAVPLPTVENLENTSLTRTMSYSIQIGAFANYVNAKNTMEKSKHDFEKHYYILEEPTASGKFLYKVVVGTYTSKEEAQEALKNLVGKGYDGFLRRI